MANANSKCFYVYLHRRKSDHIVFYVGKGTRRRANKHQARNPHWQATAKKHGWYVEIVQDGLQEWYALELEQQLIAKYDSKKLTNRTTGGDGMWASYFTPELKKYLSKVHKTRKRKPMDEEHKRRLANMAKERCTGVPIPEATKRKISEAVKRSMAKPEVKARVRLGNKSRKRNPHSEETKRKMSLAALGKPKSASHRAKFFRKIRCVETGILFDSCTSAAAWLQSLGHTKCRAGSFQQGIRNKGTTYGYHWEYID